jgi:site-specific DNA-methyltransferase (adenine-specific)
MGNAFPYQYTFIKMNEYLEKALNLEDKTLYNKLLRYKNMKFDVIIGNPPYQQYTGTGNFSTPLYHKFVLQAKRLKPQFLSIIIPDRWLGNVQGLTQFKEEMLNEDLISVMHNYQDSTDVFPQVTIGAGVCYFLWNRDIKGKCKIYTHLKDSSKNEIVEETEKLLSEAKNSIFYADETLTSILEKIKTEKILDKLITGRNPFGLAGCCFYRDLDYLTVIPDGVESVRCIGLDESRNWITKTIRTDFALGYKGGKLSTIRKERLNKWKLLFPRSTAESIYRRSFVGEPDLISTDTCLCIFVETKEQAENLKGYFATYLFRFLLKTNCNTPHVMAKAYSLVPNLEKNINLRTGKIGWDSDWTDADLQQLFNLSEDEMKYIKDKAIAADNGRDVIEEIEEGEGDE